MEHIILISSFTSDLNDEKSFQCDIYHWTFVI